MQCCQYDTTVINVSVAGKLRQFEPGVTVEQVLEDSSAIAARVDGRLVDLTSVLERDAVVEPVTFQDEEGRDVFQHSASHLLAQAVKQLFPDAKVTIGPAVTQGFYYDFDVEPPFTDTDLAKIEERMKLLASQAQPIVHRWLPRREAMDLFARRNEPYKLEIIEGLPDELISVYEQGDFVDVCRGPHLPHTGLIRAVKLLSVAGAYWHGDERNRMLSRVYGIAFPDQKQLEQHLEKLDEARRRDHRKLGPALDLFSFHEEAGAGLAFWHPKGTTIRRLLQQYWEREHLAAGYQLVVTPHIARGRLWQQSGHYDHYRENMYFFPVDEEEYVLKPMNCPGHMLLYRTKVRSYRDLPLRLAEWGTVYRYERSGVLHGMMRVRGFTQDDAHIFCTAEQVDDEVYGVVSLQLRILRVLGFDRIKVDLSVRDPRHKEKFLGSDQEWETAERSLVRTLERLALPYRRAEGEAVFYGPKIDIKLLDSLDREWQCPTCQFDFNLGPRFGLDYTGSDGRRYPVYLVHRTVLGGIERFVGILVEHYGGAFPVWLAPVQIRVMSVTDREIEYAREVTAVLVRAGLRAELDERGDKIAQKIAEAERFKIPYMLIVGRREAAGRTVSVRRHGEGDKGAVALEQFVSQVKEDANVPG